jgi:ADP-ribose pyrophosphatase YjhB (NUDIX family)
MELGETAEEAALRELREETGLLGEGPRLVGASTKPSALSGSVVVLGYRVASWSGEPRAGTDAAAVGFFTPAKRPPIPFEAHRDLLALLDRPEHNRHT